MGCEMGCAKVVMKMPVYLGQTILDLSKIVMEERFDTSESNQVDER